MNISIDIRQFARLKESFTSQFRFPCPPSHRFGVTDLLYYIKTVRCIALKYTDLTISKTSTCIHVYSRRLTESIS